MPITCPMQRAVLSPSFLGALTTLTWVCSLLDPRSGCRSEDELPDRSVIACIARLPADLKIVKLEDRLQAGTGVNGQSTDSSGSGSVPDHQEVAIDWGPMISHCFASYWECIRYALQHRDSFGPEAANATTADNVGNDLAVTHVDKAGISVGCSDAFALAQVCLESLDLAGLNLATVIECLSLLVPKVRKYGGY